MTWGFVRLSALFATLIAIFVAIGFLFGGFFGMVFALILAVFINFMGYYYSDKFVIRLYRAKEVSESDSNPDYGAVHRIVKQKADLMGLPKPKVYVAQIETPNAFATGRNPKHSAVCVTSGLLKILDKNELEGVLAHELSHIKNRDTLISTLAGTIAGAITIIAEIMWFSTLTNRDRNPLFLLAGIILAPVAATLVRLAISRGREYLADSTATSVTSPINLANALRKISAGVSAVPLRRGTRATSHMFIVNPFSRDLFTNLFSTHPPVEDRINRLIGI